MEFTENLLCASTEGFIYLVGHTSCCRYLYITASYISKVNKLTNLKMYKSYQKNSLANAVSRSGDRRWYSRFEPVVNKDKKRKIAYEQQI